MALSGPCQRHPIADLHLASDRRLSTMALALLAVLSACFVTVDLDLFGGNWSVLPSRLLVRLVLVGLPVAGILLLRRVTMRERYAMLVFLVATGVALAILALNVIRPAGSGLPLRTPLFVLAVMYAAMPNALLRQIIPPLLLTTGLMVWNLVWLRPAGGAMAGDLMVFGVLNVIGVVMVGRRIQLERDVRAAWEKEQSARVATEEAMAELRTLRGIIPICSHCKSVRTQVGDWQQIEQYVREHSEAKFSHGICPACMRQHFPELDE